MWPFAQELLYIFWPVAVVIVVCGDTTIPRELGAAVDHHHLSHRWQSHSRYAERVGTATAKLGCQSLDRIRTGLADRLGIAFAKDGTIFMTTGAATGNLAQDPNSDYGKVLHFNDDGSIPGGNPFVGRAGYKPEVYTLGHRDQLGLAIHPETGAGYSSENGPNGGDEINLILPGRNYGWPVVSYGRAYDGPRISEAPTRDAFEPPLVVWIPSIALSGMTFYSGDKFPAWKGNVFVGGMRQGEIAGTGRLDRAVSNAKMEELRRESLLSELHQRIRDVRQGPDGYIYVLTEEEDGALPRIEPAP